MTQVEILEELKKFTIPERLTIVETALRLIREDLQDAFQVRSVARERFVQRLAKLSDTAMREIATALAVVLSI